MARDVLAAAGFGSAPLSLAVEARMLRRLSLLLLLLAPAPLAAQSFTPFTAPGGDIYYRFISAGWGGPNPIPGIFSFYLLDSTGARARMFWQSGDPSYSDYGVLGTFAAGEVFGLEMAYSYYAATDRDPIVTFGSLAAGDVSLRSEIRQDPINEADMDFALATHPPAVEPEPMTMALLATGLVGLGAVGWRRRRQWVA